MGAILGDNPLRGAASGATGAVVSEMLMEAIAPTYNDFKRQIWREGFTPSEQDMREMYEKELRSYAAIAKLASTLPAFALGQDVNAAFNAADNAVENNFIPMVLFAAGAAWSAYEMYQAYQEEGLEGAAKEGAKAAALTVVGGAALKGASVVGGKIVASVSPYAQPYIKACIAQHPEVMQLVRSGAIRIENVITYVKGAPVIKTFIHFDRTVDAKVRSMVENTGRFLADKVWKKLYNHFSSPLIKLPIHKNSLDYVGETHVYSIHHAKTDIAAKVGQSAQGVRKRDGASRRAEQQVRKLRRQTGEEYYTKILTTRHFL
jgi:hypothetical protein